MIGQAPTSGRIPDRVMTRAERALWDRAMDRLDDLDGRLVILMLLNQNASAGYWFGQDNGILVAKPADLEARLLDLEKKVNHIKDLICKVNRRTLAVQFRAGDIDIVDPDQGSLEGWPLILVGVVVLAGLATALYHYYQESEDLTHKYNNVIAATDKVFCKESSPDTCAEWQAYKKDSGYTKRQSLTDRIAGGIGGTVGPGIKWGVVAAFGVLALAFAYKNR